MSHSHLDDSSWPAGQMTAAEGISFPTLEEMAALLPHYEFRRVLGVGGMGVVYLARQPGLERWVAIKVLPAQMAEHAEDAERFNTEARALARLSHPHIVAVFDFGQTDAGHLYLAMEYVEGTDLHWRTRAGEVTPDRARTVIAQLCDALQYAHAHGVIHRDIKPANILITADWQVKVVDFGLAKDLTEQAEGEAAEYGTPDYTAPERWLAGQPVDHRADIYSLGVVIHEILTGKTPHAAGAEAGLGLPEGFAGVLSKCLMHDPERRYQTAEEVRTALLAATAIVKQKEAAKAYNPPTTHGNAPLAPHPRPPRPAPSANTYRNTAWVGTLIWGMACLAAAGGLGWLVWRDHFQPPSASPGGGASPVAEAAAAAPQSSPAAPAVISEMAGKRADFSSSSDRTANNGPADAVVSEPPPMINKALPTALVLAASATSALSVDFQRQIKPIFAAKCYECHSEAKGKEKGDVALDTEAKLKACIGPGQHIVPGDPAKSTMALVCKLPDDDSDVMPPKGKNRLTPAEVGLLELWIKEGANLTSSAPPVPAPVAWTSNDGKTIQASFVALAGDQITLRMSADGKDYTFPLSRLSPESQAQAKTAAGQ